MDEILTYIVTKDEKELESISEVSKSLGLSNWEIRKKFKFLQKYNFVFSKNRVGYQINDLKFLQLINSSLIIKFHLYEDTVDFYNDNIAIVCNLQFIFEDMRVFLIQGIKTISGIDFLNIVYNAISSIAIVSKREFSFDNNHINTCVKLFIASGEEIVEFKYQIPGSTFSYYI